MFDDDLRYEKDLAIAEDIYGQFPGLCHVLTRREIVDVIRRVRTITLEEMK